eukprot:9478666-Pyramimonas_sp.AAC.1
MACFQNVALALAPGTFVLTIVRASWIPIVNVPEMVFERAQDSEVATVALTRGAEVPGMVFWRDSGSSRRDSQIDPWRWNPEDGVSACCRVFK